MARHIDDSKPLSKSDRQWLTDWARFGEIDRIDALHGDVEERDNPVFDNLTPQQSGSDGTGLQEEPEDPLKGEEFAGGEDDSEDEGGDWYEDEGVTNHDLQEELGSRELSKSGNKEELIARLRESDASDE